MHTSQLLRLFLALGLIAPIIGCASTGTRTSASQKPFDQMTAQEHRAAAAQENRLAEQSFAKVRADYIAPAATVPSGDINTSVHEETAGTTPYDDVPSVFEIEHPEAYVALPNVSEPSERYEDAATSHREAALRHERAAAALEGRPSEVPLPPRQPPLLEPAET